MSFRASREDEDLQTQTGNSQTSKRAQADYIELHNAALERIGSDVRSERAVLPAEGKVLLVG